MEKIGKYEIIDKIGEGGFGVVYKGKDPFIKRLVAVKTCSSNNEAIQQRFFREAEIAGNLHHANVVTIHDFGIEEGTPYLVQEFLTGEDLDAVMKNTPGGLTLPMKVRYLRGIAEGLSYAHAQGVIHRDIKPANIRILENHRVKVMDFGIAKLKDQESQLTQTGMTLGTVAYLSPEQLRGQDVDYRADIFSYGVLAYELVSGHRPFRADTIHSLFYQLLNEDAPDLNDLDESVPAGLNAVIQRCLAKEPSDRYESFAEMITDLDEVQAELGEDDDNESSDVFMPRAPSGAGTTGTSLLAAKARNALESGDLTAAELTINMARRDYSSEQDFQKYFADLEKEVQTLKDERDKEISGKVPIVDSAPQTDQDDTLERPPATADRKQQELPLIRMRVESLLREKKLEKAQEELSRALVEFGPDTVFSDLSAKIQAASAAGSPSLAEQAGMGNEAATMQFDSSAAAEADAKADAAKAAASKAPAARSPQKAKPSVAKPSVAKPSVAKPSVAKAQPAAPVQPAPKPAPPPVAMSASEPRKPVPIGLIAGGAVAVIFVVVVLIIIMSGGEEPTQVTENIPATEGEGTPSERQDLQSSAAPESSTPSPTAAAPTAEPESQSASAEKTADDSASQQVAQKLPAQTSPSDVQASKGETAPDRRPEPPQPIVAKPVPSKPSQKSSTPTTRKQPQTQSPSEKVAQAPPPVKQAAPKPESGSADQFSMEDMQATAAVRNAIDVYVAAWRSLDHRMVNGIFPAADAKRSDMRGYREVDVSLGDCNIQISGSSATALCPVKRTMTPKRGDAVIDSFRGFELSQSGDKWLITKELR